MRLRRLSRRLVAMVVGKPAAVAAAWRRMAAASKFTASRPAPSSSQPPTGPGHGTTSRGPVCANCGCSFIPRPAPMVNELCRNCAGHPSTLIASPLLRRRYRR